MMYHKSLIALALALMLSACASVRTDKIIAYSNYDDGDYTDAIAWIRRAESRGNVTLAIKAELAYLEAQCLEQMGEYDMARELYTYLVDQHPKTKQGYLAQSKLDESTE